MRADTDDFDDPDDADVDERDDRRNLKRALGAVTAVAVLAIVLAAVFYFGHSDSAANSLAARSGPKTAQEVARVASAHDTGPATIITDDPSCAAWMPINSSLANDGRGIWNERDRSVPASAWNDLQRMQFAAAAQSLRNAAAQTVGLVKLTPHRVMRELYEQFIAYARAYSAKIPKYTPPDNYLVGTANSAASALGAICAAIVDGAAGARGPLVPPPGAPAQVAPMGDFTNPKPLLTTANPVCTRWTSTQDQFGQQTAAWRDMNPGIPALLWNEEQKDIYYAAAQVMNAYAGTLEELGRSSGNPTWQDFADLSAQYRRAFVQGIPTYTPTDNHLANAANYLSTIVQGACATIQPT